MKSSLQLQPHQTTWSLGRIHYMAIHQPEDLVSMDRQGSLVDHLLDFNRYAQQMINQQMLRWGDLDALFITERKLFPDKIPLSKAQQVPETELQAIKNRLGITQKVEKYLIREWKEMHREDD